MKCPVCHTEMTASIKGPSAIHTCKASSCPSPRWLPFVHVRDNWWFAQHYALPFIHDDEWYAISGPEFVHPHNGLLYSRMYRLLSSPNNHYQLDTPTYEALPVAEPDFTVAFTALVSRLVKRFSIKSNGHWNQYNPCIHAHVPSVSGLLDVCTKCGDTGPIASKCPHPSWSTSNGRMWICSSCGKGTSAVPYNADKCSHGHLADVCGVGMGCVICSYVQGGPSTRFRPFSYPFPFVVAQSAPPKQATAKPTSTPFAAPKTWPRNTRLPSTINDAWEIFDVPSKRASHDEVKARLKILMVAWHPDRHPNEKQTAELHFKRANAAYVILKTTFKW